jgi:hypothetical protein
MKDPVRTATGALAQTLRKDRPADPAAVAEARNRLVAARAERMIREAIAPTDPAYEPLRGADRKYLANILLGHVE